MKIAYLVDVHNRFDAVPEAMDEVGSVDLLIIGGDITISGTRSDAEKAIEDWRRLAPQLLALAGNMDSPAIDAALADLGVWSRRPRSGRRGGRSLWRLGRPPLAPAHAIRAGRR